MLANTFKLKIVTPEEEFFQGDVVTLNCETTDGRRGILSNHCSMLAAVVPTITVFQNDNGKVHKAKTSQGVLKIKNNEAIILCDTAKWNE